MSESDTFLLGPFGKSPRAHIQVTARPLSAHSLYTVEKGACFLIRRGPVLTAPFCLHPKAKRGHTGFPHQAKAEVQLFAQLLVQLPSQLLVAGKDGVATDLVGQ